MSRRAVPSFAWSFFVAGCVVGCSSEPAASNPAVDSGIAPKDTGAAVQDTPPREPCSEPVDERPSGSQCVKTVGGKAVDSSGAPVANKRISICGQICFFSETGADGTFAANIGQFIKVESFAANVHGRPDYASIFVKLPKTIGDNVALADLVVPKFPTADWKKLPFDATKKIVTAQTLTQGDITLSFAAGTEVELDLEDAELGAQGELFRVIKVEEKDYPPAFKDAQVFALYAMTPFDSRYTNKVAVTVAQNGGLAAGTAVEFVVLGNEFVRTPFTAGTMQVAARGKTTATGAVTDVGEGLSYLTWLGVRKAP